MQRSYALIGVGLVMLAAGIALSVAGSWIRVTRGPVTMEAAAEIVRQELGRLGYTDLVPKEVMEFTNHFYVQVVEKSSGKGAMELLVDHWGFTYPEPRPNMMWNGKYGHMGGWMVREGAGAPLSLEQARERAQEFLNETARGATAGHGTEFYGYFTFHVERGGKPFGMLSVNAYTSQVWYHGWHGVLLRQREFE